MVRVNNTRVKCLIPFTNHGPEATRLVTTSGNRVEHLRSPTASIRVHERSTEQSFLGDVTAIVAARAKVMAERLPRGGRSPRIEALHLCCWVQGRLLAPRSLFVRGFARCEVKAKMCASRVRSSLWPSIIRGRLNSARGCGSDWGLLRPLAGARFFSDGGTDIRAMAAETDDSVLEVEEYLNSFKNFEKDGVPKGAGTGSDEGFDLGRMSRLLSTIGDPISKYQVSDNWVQIPLHFIIRTWSVTRIIRASKGKQMVVVLVKCSDLEPAHLETAFSALAKVPICSTRRLIAWCTMSSTRTVFVVTLEGHRECAVVTVLRSPSRMTASEFWRIRTSNVCYCAIRLSGWTFKNLDPDYLRLYSKPIVFLKSVLWNWLRWFTLLVPRARVLRLPS